VNLRVDDLQVAWACSKREPQALRRFEACLDGAIRFVARMDPSFDFLDEVRQTVRCRLLIEENGTARITSYEGRAPLQSWLRTIATRVARELRAKRGLERNLPVPRSARAREADPELEYLKRRSTREFRPAFEGAVQALEGRERTLLRLYFLEQVSMQSLARIYHVHESTVSRWIGRIKGTLIERIRDRLTADLHLSPEELPSLEALVYSRIDVELAAFFEKR
jgi:RNA polymerase sigma-70 factor